MNPFEQTKKEEGIKEKGEYGLTHFQLVNSVGPKVMYKYMLMHSLAGKKEKEGDQSKQNQTKPSLEMR